MQNWSVLKRKVERRGWYPSVMVQTGSCCCSDRCAADGSIALLKSIRRIIAGSGAAIVIAAAPVDARLPIQLHHSATASLPPLPRGTAWHVQERR